MFPLFVQSDARWSPSFMYREKRKREKKRIENVRLGDRERARRIAVGRKSPPSCPVRFRFPGNSVAVFSWDGKRLKDRSVWCNGSTAAAKPQVTVRIRWPATNCPWTFIFG